MFPNLKILQILFFLSLNFLTAQETSSIFILPQQLQWANPALLHTTKNKQLSFLFESQWLGIPRAPRQQSFLFVSKNKNKKVTFGVVLRNRSEFAENQSQMIFQFAFPLQLDETTFLHLGIQGGGKLYDLNFENAQSVDGVNIDPVLKNDTQWIPNAGIGIHFIRKNTFFSVSFPRLLEELLTRHTTPLILQENLFYTIAFGRTYYNLFDVKKFEWEVLFHNLAFGKDTIQIKGNYYLPFTTLYLGFNNLKYSNVGFQLISKGAFQLSYAFEFPLARTLLQPRNNHAILIHLNLLPKTKLNEP